MKALQLIAALAFLVIIHEFGHYIFARIFGIKVEKFYLFFNPWFSLVKWKPKEKPGADPAKPSWRDTEYGIGWLPLGGYCKIAGMVDESVDTEQLAQEPQPWEFRTKPAYQRLLVMLGGVLFNFILAIIIYAGIAFHWGEKYINLTDATEGMDFVPSAIEAGFRNGDIPLLADGKPLESKNGEYAMQMAQAKTVTVLRNKRDTVTISLPDKFIFRLNDDKGFLAFRLPAYIDRLIPGGPAAKAQMCEGDRILMVDTIATPTMTELAPALAQYAGTPVSVTLQRDNSVITLTATPDAHGKLGFQLRPITSVYPTVNTKFSLLGSIPKGWEIGTSTLSNYVGSMRHVFTSEGAQSLGGFGSIGNLFPERWNWYSFWQITAFLSVALAFMNIIPIPGLDGGHVIFLLYEIISRRKAPENVLIIAQYIGMAFLLLLLIYANGNDIFRAFFK